ncbi:ww rsp5 wwp [Alternaria alternata]|nr:ww rsp5 wwp [Alternaria alternata]
MLLLRCIVAKSTVARSLRNPGLITIHVLDRLCSTTSEYCCRPQTTLIRRYHHEAVIGHAPFPQQYRHYSSSSIDHKIPAVFVDASKNAGIWEQDWGFVVYRADFSDSDVWERFKETFSRMNDRSFDKLATFYSNPDDVRVSQRFWRCRFVDEPGLEGKDPATIRE